MSDLQNLLTLLIRRMALEEEYAELVPQLRPLERDIQKLKVEANNKQLDADQLTRPGLRNRVLGWTGKKEAALTNAIREARTAREHLNAAEYRLETLRSRTTTIRQELDATADTEEQFLRQWEQQAGHSHTEARALLQQLKQSTELLTRLPEEVDTLKSLLSVVERYYVTGDIQTDLTGHRYDNKFRTMKAHCPPCQDALTALLATLSTYTDFFDIHLQAVASGPWTNQTDYLTAQSFDAKELFERVDQVSCWLSQLEFALKTQNSQAAAMLLSHRKALRDCLLALPDER